MTDACPDSVNSRVARLGTVHDPIVLRDFQGAATACPATDWRPRRPKGAHARFVQEGTATARVRPGPPPAEEGR